MAYISVFVYISSTTIYVSKFTCMFIQCSNFFLTLLFIFFLLFFPCRLQSSNFSWLVSFSSSFWCAFNILTSLSLPRVLLLSDSHYSFRYSNFLTFLVFLLVSVATLLVLFILWRCPNHRDRSFLTVPIMFPLTFIRIPISSLSTCSSLKTQQLLLKYTS